MLPGVSKTAILTLRARVDEQARPDRILEDPVAAQWWSRVTWPRELDAWYATQYGLGFRAADIDHIVERAAHDEPVGTVVELGVGLSTRRFRLAELPGLERWVDVDLPAVAELRRSWGVTPAEDQLGVDVLDHRWMDAVPDARLFVVEGLLYYLPKPDVVALFSALRARFSGARVVMDVLGRGDFAKLREHTEALGSPIRWSHDGPLERAASDLGLSTVEGFEPDRLTAEMLARYGHRFDNKMRGAIFLAQQLPALWAARSGIVMGRL